MIERKYLKLVDSDRLKSEILANTNSIPLESITQHENELIVSLNEPCTEELLAELDGIVANHINTPAPSPFVNAHIWDEEKMAVTSTSKTAIPVHSWDIPEICTGWYKLSWMGIYGVSDKNSTVTISIEVDGNTIHNVTGGRQYAKESTTVVSGFSMIELPTIKTHNVSLKIAMNKDGSITMYNSTFELEKLQP